MRRKAISPSATVDKGDAVTAYAAAVAGGSILAGPWVRLACARHLDDVRQGGARGLRWDWPVARRVIEFFPTVLRLAEGDFAGTPFVLQDWQKFLVGSLFGWFGPDGFRRYRTCYAEVGKGNGKSPLAAGLGLYGMLADGEIGAQVYSAATTREQAKIVWGDAQGMVRASPSLRARVVETVNNLAHIDSSSFFRPVSADASKLDGFRPYFVIADEVHEHPSAQVIDKMRAGFKGRRQPMMIEITNSGFDRHSICWQHHEYSIKLLEGTIVNDSWFAYVCGLDVGDDWRDEAVWAKANPNIDISITRKYLREQVQEACDMPPKENIVRRLNFCEWTEQSVRAIDIAQWNACGPPANTDWRAVQTGIAAAVADLRGRRCYGGLDLARVNDLSAFVLLFPPDEPDEPWRVLCRFWVPADDITHRSLRDRVPYDVWQRQGFLFGTPGNVTDFAFIQHQIIADAAQFDIAEIAFDRTFAGEIVQNLAAEGLEMVEFGQGFLSMAAPMSEILRLVKSAALQHYGHPILRWCASNLTVASDPAGNLKPDKSRSSERIDGISALCNALGRAMQAVDDVPYGDGRSMLVL